MVIPAQLPFSLVYIDEILFLLPPLLFATPPLHTGPSSAAKLPQSARTSATGSRSVTGIRFPEKGTSPSVIPYIEGTERQTRLPNAI
jgi:hypothetical protein